MGSGSGVKQKVVFTSSRHKRYYNVHGMPEILALPGKSHSFAPNKVTIEVNDDAMISVWVYGPRSRDLAVFSNLGKSAGASPPLTDAPEWVQEILTVDVPNWREPLDVV